MAGPFRPSRVLEELVNLALSGQLDDARCRQLEGMLREDRDALRWYRDMASLQIDLRTLLTAKRVNRRALAQIESISRGSPEPVTDSVAPRAIQPVSRSPLRGFFRRVTRPLRRYRGDPRYALAMVWISTLLFAGVVAGVVAAVSVMFRGANLPGDQQIAEQGPAQPPTPAGPVARLIRVSDCVWSGEINSPFVGSDLVAGRKLVLKSGLAEFVFRNGAKTIVEGPAVCEFSSSASVELSRGKCAATAEGASARGFAIHAPGMTYTDLGTEFGVLVAESGVQEMHVFRGRVQAEQGGEPGAGIREQRAASKEQRAGRAHSVLSAPHSLLVVSANEAIRVAAPDPSGKPAKPIEHIAADEKRFVRVILDPIPLFSTGVGLDRGANDSHWEITKISTDAPLYRKNQLAKPQAAVVAVLAPNYVPDNRDKAQWISESKAKGIMPDGCRWTIRTHFDLSGLDPSSARIEGQISVDDYLVEIRLNGKSVPIPAGSRVPHLHAKWLPLKIEEAFVSGDNTLEIVIENGKTVDKAGSEMGLCIDWKGAARPPLKLKSKN